MYLIILFLSVCKTNILHFLDAGIFTNIKEGIKSIFTGWSMIENEEIISKLFTIIVIPQEQSFSKDYQNNVT